MWWRRGQSECEQRNNHSTALQPVVRRVEFRRAKRWRPAEPAGTGDSSQCSQPHYTDPPHSTIFSAQVSQHHSWLHRHRFFRIHLLSLVSGGSEKTWQYEFSVNTRKEKLWCEILVVSPSHQLLYNNPSLEDMSSHCISSQHRSDTAENQIKQKSMVKVTGNVCIVRIWKKRVWYDPGQQCKPDAHWHRCHLIDTGKQPINRTWPKCGRCDITL